MIAETAAAFVSTITALSSVVKAIRTAKEFTDDALALSEEIASKPELENDSVQALAATNIDEEFIEIATQNIEKALKRLKLDWRDPSVSQAGKDQALETAGFIICAELGRVKKLNGGALPGTDRFHDLWASHSCEQAVA